MIRRDTREVIGRRRRWLSWLVVLFLVPLLAACAQQAQRPPLKVVATVAPLADWARQVGQERVQVTQIVPAGVDPKTYVLTDADRRALAEAQVVLANGLGLEPWLAGMLTARDPQTFVALQLSDFIGPLVQGKPVTSRSSLAGAAEEGQSAEREQVTSVYVPATVFSSYLWLNPGADMAQKGVLFIADTFTRADPANIRFYRGNAERYVGKLENLDVWIKQQIEKWPLTRNGSKQQRVIQVADRSWYYFAQRYDITLRTLANGRSTAAPGERQTALFVNRYMDADTQRRLGRVPDGVLDALVSDSYVETIKRNVEMMSQGVQQAAARSSTLGSVPSLERQAP
jgi:ABC-type Zn uptake system ZnuABC Zn-binding protein ZnuA